MENNMMMGDEADRLIDDGLDAFLLHFTGMCDSIDPCQYCEDEEKSREKIAALRKKK
jgi:hypothetical protein